MPRPFHKALLARFREPKRIEMMVCLDIIIDDEGIAIAGDHDELVTLWREYSMMEFEEEDFGGLAAYILSEKERVEAEKAAKQDGGEEINDTDGTII